MSSQTRLVRLTVSTFIDVISDQTGPSHCLNIHRCHLRPDWSVSTSIDVISDQTGPSHCLNIHRCHLRPDWSVSTFIDVMTNACLQLMFTGQHTRFPIKTQSLRVHDTIFSDICDDNVCKCAVSKIILLPVTNLSASPISYKM